MKENNLTDLKKMKLNGSVKTFEEISYIPKVINGIIEKYFRKRMNFNEDDFKIYFNQYGNIVEEIKYFHLDGTIMGKNVYVYDSNQNLIEESNFEYDNDLILKRKYVNIYDSKSNLIEKKEFNHEELIVSNTRHKYNDVNKVIEDYEYTSENTFKLSRSYKYDNNNFLIQETIHLENFDRYFLYKNDSTGNCVESRAELSNGNTEYIEKIKYDNNNNMTEYLRVKSDGSFDSREIHKYDLSNNLVEHVWYINEFKYEEKVVIEYDKFSNIISYTKYDVNGNIKNKVTCRYKYDSNNNWIECVKFDENNSPYVIYERIFDYY